MTDTKNIETAENEREEGTRIREAGWLSTKVSDHRLDQSGSVLFSA